MQYYINRILIDAYIEDSDRLSWEVQDKTGIENVFVFSGNIPNLHPRDVVISNNFSCNTCLKISSRGCVESDFVYSDNQDLYDIIKLINSIDYKLLAYLTRIVVERIYKVSKTLELDGFIEFLQIYFSNGLSIRCIPVEIFRHRCFAKKNYYESNADILMIDIEILDADIGKTRCNIKIMNSSGGIVYQGVETVRLSVIYKEGV